MESGREGGSDFGIMGIGAYLPEQVRTNDWWPAERTGEWRTRNVRGEARTDAPQPTPVQAIVLDAQAATFADPFRGARARRVLAEGVSSTDIEQRAAEAALEDAGVPAGAVDLLLTYSLVPDYLGTNTAAALHERLSLPRGCFSLSVEAASNSFQMQLALAGSMIRTGMARCALLVQSSVASRILPYSEAFSTQFGDAATAVVVGSRGVRARVVAQAHSTDGTHAPALVTGIPGKSWHDEGRCQLYSRDLNVAQQVFLDSAGVAKEVIEQALAKAQQKPEEVSFLACHQPSVWFRSAVQKAAGLTAARSIDSFAWAGNTLACNLPLVLASAVSERMLRPGDLVCLFSGGNGATMSSTLLRWGER